MQVRGGFPETFYSNQSFKSPMNLYKFFGGTSQPARKSNPRTGGRHTCPFGKHQLLILAAPEKLCAHGQATDSNSDKHVFDIYSGLPTQHLDFDPSPFAVCRCGPRLSCRCCFMVLILSTSSTGTDSSPAALLILSLANNPPTHPPWSQQGKPSQWSPIRSKLECLNTRQRAQRKVRPARGAARNAFLAAFPRWLNSSWLIQVPASTTFQLPVNLPAVWCHTALGHSTAGTICCQSNITTICSRNHRHL